MKAFMEKVLLISGHIRKKILAAIDRLAKNEIDKANREYELRYGQSLNEDEIIEIKKNTLLRLWKIVGVFLILLVFLLSQI
ncbi:hypothetical protein [Halobacillus amylolyticus]|uniref:Holin n=1 Tax=Halobacillus amylolyticus TaxID=2932259 RepID=A0ABY4HGL6_9BACI|nr:hypothetical protein [Halobacillus amylolyticus]UOR14080.1 hypothetical protein MUO15_21225 [Halobacillus amylolyticus]